MLYQKVSLPLIHLLICIKEINYNLSPGLFGKGSKMKQDKCNAWHIADVQQKIASVICQFCFPLALTQTSSH